MGLFAFRRLRERQAAAAPTTPDTPPHVDRPTATDAPPKPQRRRGRRTPTPLTEN